MRNPSFLRGIMAQAIKQRSLGQNTLWSLAGHVINGGGRMLLFILAARYFEPEQTGVFFWTLAVATPVVYFFNLELRLSYVTDTSGKYHAGDMLAMRIVSNIAAMSVLSIIAIILAIKDSSLSAALLLMCGLTRGTECFADSFIGVMQKREKMQQAAFSYIMRTAVIISLVITAGLNKWPIWCIPLIWITAVLLINRSYETRVANKLADIKINFNKGILFQIFRESLPLGAFMAIATLNTESGKYFIKAYLTNSDIAYYTIAITIINGTMMTQNGINQGVLRRMSIYHHIDRKQFNTLLLRVLLVATIIMSSVILLFWTSGKQLLSTFIRPEYAENLYDKGPVLMIMLTGGLLIIWAMVTGDAVVACREFNGRMRSMVASLVTNLILCYYLTAVKGMGLSGIAWAFTGSAAVNLAVNIYYLLKVRQQIPEG